MLTKKVIVVFLTFVLCLLFATNIRADDGWTEVISDPNDASSSADIRRIYVRDDGHDWSFKIESWKNWKLEKSNLHFRMFFNTSCTSYLQDSDYHLAIFGEDNFYFGFFAEIGSETFTLVVCDMKESDKIGTFSISKNDLLAPKRKFTMNAYIMDLNHQYTDAAPDNQSMVEYESSQPPPPTKLIIKTTELDFGEVRWNSKPFKYLYFLNQGERTVNIDISTSPNIQVSKKKITLSEYERSYIQVGIACSTLSKGKYTEFVKFESNYGNATVPVTFEVLPKPILAIDLDQIQFGDCYRGDRTIITIHVYNKLKGPMNTKLITNADWFRLSETEFDENGKYIDVYLTTKKAEAGLLKGEIRIDSDGGYTRIPVEANLLSSFVLNPTSIEYGEVDFDHFENEAIQYTLQNNTDHSLKVQITNTESWIQCANTAITLREGETKELKILLNVSEMKEVNKRYQGSIVFESEYDVIELPVSIHLTQTPPMLKWLESDDEKPSYKASIYQGQSFEHSFKISNCGSGELDVDFSIDKSEANFRLFTRPCKLKADECEDILVKLDSRTLEIGTYKTTLSITSNGGNLDVPIVVEILEIPVVIITLTIGSAIATINDEVIMLEEAPYIQKGTTMVPLRFVGEAFNAEIEWKNIGKGRIIMKAGENTIQLDIGKTVALINGEPKLLPVAPEIKSGRTFVPLRFIGESFGATIDWDGEVQMITITYTMPIPQE